MAAYWNFWKKKARQSSRWNNQPAESPAIKKIFTSSQSLDMRLAVCVIAALVLVAGERHGAFGPVRTSLAVAVYPIQLMVSTPVRFVQDLFQSLKSCLDILEENRKLRDDALILKTRQLKFAALEQENIRLRGLLDSSFKVGERVLIAELLSIKLVPYEHVVEVNKGTRFGVYAGQPVFDANGVVGQVLRTNPLSAEVMLITDPSHAIPVQVNRNGLRTIALGTGHLDRLALPYLSGNADIQVGDLLITSGLGGGFPHGYPVATVTAIASQESPFAKISATPIARLDRNRELLLAFNNADPVPRSPVPAAAVPESPVSPVSPATVTPVPEQKPVSPSSSHKTPTDHALR